MGNEQLFGAHPQFDKLSSLTRLLLDHKWRLPGYILIPEESSMQTSNKGPVIHFRLVKGNLKF